MKTLFVRIAPQAGPEKFFSCGIEFSRAWKAVNDLDNATVARLKIEQMLETSETQPAGYTPAETPVSGGDTSAVNGGGVQFASPGPLTPTIATCGDSLTAQSLLVTGNNFRSRATESVFNFVDALMGAPFSHLDNYAVGGKTCRQMIDEQFPVMLAKLTKPKYCWFTIGHNDIYSEAASVDVTYARIVEAITLLMGNGIVPIWSTVWGRSYDAVMTPRVSKLNDLLRAYAASTNCGIFWDGAHITIDPSSATNEGRLPLAAWYFDANIHPNNVFCFRIAQYCVSQISGLIAPRNTTVVGNDDLTFTGAAANLLTNPAFIGSGAASGTGITGVFPTGWKVDWATRTGSASAACAIVPITDPATGFVIANALELTISGAASANDVLRVYQSDTENAGLKSNLSTGNFVQTEVIYKVASGANISQVAHRVQANTSESTWCGLNGQTSVALPSVIPALTLRSAAINVLGSGVATQARQDTRITFNGAGTGSVITVWRPRVRKVSQVTV